MGQNNHFQSTGAHEADDRDLTEVAERQGRNGHWRGPNQARLAAVPPREALTPGISVVGYASVSASGGVDSLELKQQAAVIERECEQKGFILLELVGERESANSKALDRPGLSYALERIASGEAKGLIVSELSRLTHSAADLGMIIGGLTRCNARLVAAAHALDTDDEQGRLAADLLVEISTWERDRLSERTRNGLRAARSNGGSTGRAAVIDDPDLSERIVQMRARGMTLQAIADRLNEDGVPTVRGGTKWRHSSVQAAAGYQRRRRVGLSDWVAQERPVLAERKAELVGSSGRESAATKRAVAISSASEDLAAAAS
jgi:DNA invertase Pin-like site-specific DNA recombinase